MKPSLVLEAAPSWADESERAEESQVAARSTGTSSLVLRERVDGDGGAGVSEQAEGTLAVRGDGVVAMRTKTAEDTVDVDLEEDDPGA